MKKTIISFDKFEDMFNSIEKDVEVAKEDQDAVQVINRIDGYIDCLGSILTKV